MLMTFNATERPESAERLLDEPDEALLVACRNGCRDAQRRLYERFGRRTYRLLVRMVGPDAADDLLQDVFIKVFRSLDRFDGRSAFGSWLHRLTLNEAFQYLRRHRRRRWTTLVDEVADRRNVANDDSDDRELLARALERLDPDLRAVFLLREVEQLSYSELAEATQVSEGTVASRLSRARMLLKRFLVAAGWTP